nr:reverse transcriptase domain-containing protein [Tanacetum cinerariifolium]
MRKLKSVQQRNDQGLGANGGVEGVNGNIEEVNGGVGGAPDFSMIIAQQLQNLLPAMLAQVSNQENVGNQNGNVVNENVQENVRNVLVNGNRNHAMVGAGHAAYTDKFHELARLVPHLVTLESKKIERNGSIKKVEKRENVGELSKDKNSRNDDKRTRTGNAFATTANPVGRENTGPCRTCFNYNRPCHLVKDCRGVPRNVNPVNARNPTVRV